jgi:hypothetical protein
MKNVVVFTGLPRMPKRFKQSVSEMNELMEKGLLESIHFVTWQGRLDGMSDLREHLRANGVVIREHGETKFGGRSNIWHQMRALDIGLRNIPSECSVLKTRSDVHIDVDFLERLFAGEIGHMNEPAGSGVFENRIWVPWAEIQSPFMMCDFCFYGHRNDLTKLVNYDARYDALYHLVRGVAATRRFIHPYLRTFSFLHSYLSKFKGPERDHDLLIDRHGLTEHRLQSPVFGAFLAFYYKCLLNDFYIDYSPVRFKNRRMFAGDNENEARYYDEFTLNFTQGPNTGRHDIFCTDQSWLESQLRNEPIGDVPTGIANGVKRSFEDWRTFEIDEGRLASDVEAEDVFFRDNVAADLPKNWFTLLVGNRILEPLGLKRPVMAAYSRFIDR